MLHEMFRFNAVRGVQRATPSGLKSKLITCDVPDQGHILTHVPPPPVPLSVETARAVFDSEEMVHSLNVLNLPIAALDLWLLDHRDHVAPAKVEKEVVDESGAASLTDLIQSDPYKTDRRRVAASLAVAFLLPEAPQRLRITLVRAMHVFGLIEELATRTTLVKTSADVYAFLSFATVILPQIFPMPSEALARPPAIADLKVVRQKLLRYETNEIAHIENVLKRESKSRVHRRRDMRQEMLLTDTERETSEERELQTSDRFEMQKETSSVISDDMRLQAGANISASYGPTVSATLTADFEMNHSQEESVRASRSFAHEVTERSASRIKERTRTQRTVTVLNEVEETNTHGIDNQQGTEHVIGVYRYVDKIYQAQVYNYGKRLLLEFIVPEPAAFVRQVMEKPIIVDMELPEKPTMSLGTVGLRPLAPTDIARNNYMQWAAKYFAQEIAPPPEAFIWIPLGWDLPANPDTGITPEMPARKIYKVNQTLEVPTGYKAVEVRGIIGVSDWKEDVAISIADVYARLTQIPGAGGMYQFDLALPNSPHGKIPFGMVIENCWGYEITMHVKCQLLQEGFEKWQMETFNKIMQAYFELKATYDEKVTAAAIQRGVSFDGRNPGQNRKIERTELHKHVISMLEQTHFDRPPINEEAIDHHGFLVQGFNEIKFEVAQKEKNFIQWFEQAFEWQNMTYVFYPYYWGRKYNWIEDVMGQDTDPLFNDFLRAGAARVIVPVRPGFEKAMGLYLSTGIIWNGGQAPQIGDPLFISVVQELQEQLGAPDEGKPEGEPWEFSLPTPLVILQEKGEL